MNSSIPSNASPAMLLCIGFYYAFVILLFWRNNISRFDTYNSRQPLLIFLVFVHLLFAFEGGDYFHYWQNISSHDMGHAEEVYHVIAKAVGYNYLLFRAVVWGSALLLFIKTSQRFGLDVYKAVFLLYAMFFTIFDYARASLGMSIFFYGVSFLCVPIKRHKLFSFLLGYAIIFSSVLFHRSMIMAILSTIFLFVPFKNKKALIVVLLLFMLFVPYLNSLLGFALNSTVMKGSGDIYDTVLHYSEQEVDFSGASIYEKIRNYVVFFTFYFPVVLVSLKIFRKTISLPQHTAMLKLYGVTVGLLLTATSTLLTPSLGSIILFYRLLYFSMIPTVILFLYSRQKGIVSPKAFTFTVVLCLLTTFFNYSKRLLGGNL